MKTMTIGLIVMVFIYNVMMVHGVISKNEQNNEFVGDKGKKIHQLKDCSIVEECRQCTFEELKHDQICQMTGFKIKHHCIFDNHDEEYYSEACDCNKLFNSVYALFVLCVIIVLVAWKFQKNQKASILKNVFDKLSLFKDTNQSIKHS